MYWLPVVPSAGQHGALPTVSPQSMNFTLATTPPTAQAPTPSDTHGASMACGMPGMIQSSVAAPGSQSSDAQTLLHFSPQQTPVAQTVEGAGMAASFVPGMMHPNQTHFISLSDLSAPHSSLTPTFQLATGNGMMTTPGAPVAFTAPAAPIGSYPPPMHSGGSVGSVFNMAAAPLANYPTGSVSGIQQSSSFTSANEDTLHGYTPFSSSAQVPPQLCASAVPCFPPTGAFFFQSPPVASPGNLAPPPRYCNSAHPSPGGTTTAQNDLQSAVVAHKTISGSQSTPIVRNGDAGKGYEAGVYYEGRVKRFNPIRGYGFVSATYKLIPLKDSTKKTTAEAGESCNITERQANTPHEQTLNCTETSAAKHRGSENTSFISDSEEFSLEAKELDVVYIKGVPHSRHPVTMGDIFVHYHCLQRNSSEVDATTSGGLVNLPVGSRVQFKAEVFVPAELMEKASDSKEAAQMLNKLGIPVEYNPNLLSGAIAATKGWGYQAIDVHLLPPKGTLPIPPSFLDPAAVAEEPTGVYTGEFFNSSSASSGCVSPHNDATDGKQMSSLNNQTSRTAPRPVSYSHSPQHPLDIRIPVEKNNLPPPPSFEAATAGMQYIMTPPNVTMYMPNYILSHYM